MIVMMWYYMYYYQYIFCLDFWFLYIYAVLVMLKLAFSNSEGIYDNYIMVQFKDATNLDNVFRFT